MTDRWQPIDGKSLAAWYAGSTRTARDISAPLGCTERSSIRTVDQPPISCTTRKEIPAATIAEASVCGST